MKIFVSGVMFSHELDNERTIAIQTIRELSYEPIAFAELVQDNVNPDETLKLMTKSDIFLLLLNENLTSWVQFEYSTALHMNKPILVFLKDSKARDKTLRNFLYRNGTSFTLFNDNNFQEQLRRAIWSAVFELRHKPVEISEKIRNPRWIYIEPPQTEWVKIGAVQLDFDLTDSFPFSNKLIDYTSEVIKDFVKIARDNYLDIIVFPELSINNEINNYFLNNIGDDLIFIAGSYYNEGRNICPVIFKSENFAVEKIHPSKFEDSPLKSHCMISDSLPFIFETKNGRFSVLICDDFRHERDRIYEYIDFILVPSYNPKPDNFRQRASIYVEDYHKYIIISNVGKYGYSAIYGVIDEDYFDHLKQEGFKSENSPKYELAHIPPGKEGILIAQFNILNKSVIVPTEIKDKYSNVRDIEILDRKGKKLY